MYVKRSIVFFLAATVAVAGAHAAQPAARTQRTGPDGMLFAAPPVSDARLMRMRGGFDLGNGLLASFGISRLVYVDGNLVSRTSINIPDLSHISTAQLNALAATLGTVNIIRNGPGNTVAPQIGQELGATVIQNTLNNQNIRTLTNIDATVKDLGAFHGINLNNSLQSAVINSLGH